MALKNMDPLSLEDPAETGGEEEGREEKKPEGEEETGAWEHQAQVPVKVLRAHSSGLTSVHFCFQDSHVLSSSADSTSILWDIERGVPLRIFEGGHAAAISECAVIPNSNKMVTVSWDKKMVAWDMETGQTLWTSKLTGLLTSCSVSSDGRLVVCAEDLQNGVYISDAASGQTLNRLTNHHGSTITRCRFDPQSQRIATVSADRTIKLWDLVAKKTTLSINSNHSNVISNCCFTNNGHFLCTASWDKTLQLWDLQTGTFRSQGGIRLEKGHEGSVSSCAFSTDANLLVSSSYDRTVTVWDMSALCDAYSLKGHLDWVTDVSISADKKRVASASKDGTARLWNTENLEEIPEVLEKRRSWGMGIHIVKCEECGNPLSLPRPETSELLTKCVWCRLKSPTR